MPVSSLTWTRPPPGGEHLAQLALAPHDHLPSRGERLGELDLAERAP